MFGMRPLSWYGGTPCPVPADAADRQTSASVWAADAVPVFVHRVFLLPYRGAIPPAFFYSISHFGSKSKVLSENHSQIIFARSLQKTQNMVLSYQLLLMGVDEMPVRKKHQKTLLQKRRWRWK